MANGVAVSRAQLIFGICVPLAVLIGYFLAEPLDSGSLALVVMVLAILSVPLMMRWSHPILVLSWNAVVNPYFLPGQPSLWMLMAFGSLFFALLNRSVDPECRFLSAPQVSASLLVFGGVVFATAFMSGGIGMRSLGSAMYGGRGYFYIVAAIVGYFALTSRQIPVEKAGLLSAMFFLPGLTSVVSNLAFAAGPKFYFLFELFPSGLVTAAADIGNDPMGQGVFRVRGMAWASLCVFCWLLARYGVRGILDLSKPWRLALLVGTAIAGLLGGFRSVVLIFALTFLILFMLEGLHKTLFTLGLGLAVIIFGALVVVAAPKMPYPVQRALSFLPIAIDPVAKQDAQGSTEWRLEMWQNLLPEVPKYLFKGKGLALDPNELFMAHESAARGFGSQSDPSMVAGSYHNGPLSILIPFGIYGALAFVWFLIAGWRVLHRFCRAGDVRLQKINRLILALFAARALMFLIFFGAIEVELFYFTGLVGFGVSLNGGTRRTVEAPEEGELSWEVYGRPDS